MFLKSLEIFGFKSFADRTKIQFLDGITALLGPNGCGKSNVVDAVKWVLGEQASKTLRAGKMEDVIFKGTDTRKPLNVAEVTLTISNDGGILPLEYSEIAIKRRLYRSGESEYFVNGQPAKLKDIRELFWDTGVGKAAYSVMEQGKIDQILSSKPEERRYFFEEAAGITRYKARGAEAERNLQRTEENMRQAEGILAEVKRSHDTLKVQAEKAVKYRDFKEEIFQTELDIQLLKLKSFTRDRDSRNEELEKIKGKQAQVRAEIEAINASLEQNMDVVNTMRNAFHATTETRLYGDIGGVPAFVEEAGSLGPGLSSDDRAALYLRNLLWNALAHDCRGVLWWCAHDQSELPQAPYDWNSIERELGLLRPGYHPKPVMKVFSEFSRRLEELQLHHLPVFRRDAVVLLSHDQDSWTVAHAAWLLAKQAGFDVEFQKADQPLKPASLYLLPSIRGTRVIDRRRYLELLARVRDGATLAVTGDGGILQPFASKFGVEVDYLAAATAPLVVSNRDLYFECPGEFLQKLRNIDAEVLAVDADGDPACTLRACGAGKLIYLNAPLEYSAGRTPRMFMPGAPEFYRVYRMAAAAAGIRRIVTSGNPFVTMTEHREAPDQLRVLAVNNLPETVEIIPEIAAGWQLVSVDGGEVPTGNQLRVRGNDALVLTLRNNSPNLNEPR